MTKRSASKLENTSDFAVSKQYVSFLQRKVDTARRSLKGEGLSNEEIESEFAARRAQAAESIGQAC
jgi:hypothetical protein